MKYAQIQPPNYLKNYIRYYWTLESISLDTLPKTFLIIADGCPGLMFQQTQMGAYYDVHEKQLPDIFLYGQATMHAKIYSFGKLKTIGVCFYPNALRSVFGLNAEELTNSCLDLNLTSGTQGFRLRERLVSTSSIVDQIEILSAYICSRIKKNDRQAGEIVQYALSQIVTSHGSIPLEKLQENLQLSERSFERKFKQWVGISPNLFSRVCRFQTSLNQVRNNNYHKLSDIAFDNGYADQSHFIRAFKEFCGLPPNQYQKQSKDVIENLLELTE